MGKSKKKLPKQRSWVAQMMAITKRGKGGPMRDLKKQRNKEMCRRPINEV